MVKTFLAERETEVSYAQAVRVAHAITLLAIRNRETSFQKNLPGYIAEAGLWSQPKPTPQRYQTLPSVFMSGQAGGFAVQAANGELILLGGELRACLRRLAGEPPRWKAPAGFFIFRLVLRVCRVGA